MAPNKIRVSVEPFRRILADKLEGLEDNDEIVQKRHELSRMTGIHERLLYRIIGGQQEHISFDNADRIVTGILGPMAWHADDELAEIYWAVDMRAVDWANPPSEKVAEGMGILAIQEVRKHGTVKNAAKHLGISTGTLSRRLSKVAVAREAA